MDSDRLAHLEQRVRDLETEVAGLEALLLSYANPPDLSEDEWARIWDGALSVVERRWPEVPHDDMLRVYKVLIGGLLGRSPDPLA